MNIVDVVIPCYRYACFLRESVESVLKQSHAGTRVLIIDDASPDNTAEVAEELAAADPRVTVLRHPSNKGHTYSYNEGIEWAASPYSLLLSADDYLLPGALERAVAVMDANPVVGLVFGRGVELAADGSTSAGTPANTAIARYLDGSDQAILSGSEFFRLVEANAAANIVPTPTAVVKTQLQKQLGGYRTDLPHTGDLEMWLRLAANSAVGMISDYQAVSRMHGNNMQYQYYRNRYLPDLQHRRAALDAVFESCGHLLPERDALHSGFNAKLAGTALGYASGAINDGDEGLCEEFCRIATSLNPEVTGTYRWMVVSGKRRLGPAMCKALSPAWRWVRQLTSRSA